MIKLLIVDDENLQNRAIQRVARDAGFEGKEIDAVKTEQAARDLIGDHEYQLAIIDLMLSDPPLMKEGLRLIAELRAKQPLCRIIGLTTKSGTDAGVEMMEAGAHDFVSSAWEHLPWVDLLKERLRLWRGLIEKRSGPQHDLMDQPISQR